MNSRPHQFDLHRDICMACGLPREDLLAGGPTLARCSGMVKYREFIFGLTFVRQPIVPQAPRS